MTRQPFPIACHINALTPEERRHRASLWQQLQECTKEITVLPDGYAFCFVGDEQLWMTAATFVDLERRCCPFLNFISERQPDNAVRLKMTGPEGVKAFIENQFDLQPLL